MTTTTKKRSSVSVTQFLALIVATIVLSLVVDFGRKVAPYRRLQLEEARLDQAIEYEKARQDYLLWLKGYVQTAAFVDDWARTEWKMVKPGETAVIPMFPEASIAPQARPREGSPPSGGSRWREWLGVFFGDS
ncbi:MAG: hypothetical protein H8E47_02980 [Anaerolineales bacterium]|nr:hypothetical protein [Anaerolineales bacterium]